MLCWKPWLASRREYFAKPRSKKFRLEIEELEDRFQPSLTALPLGAVAAYPITTGLEPLTAVALSTVVHEAHPLFMLNTATYITGTTGSATARGIALGPDGSTYETGTITQAGSLEAYAAKYDPSGNQVYFDPFQLRDNTNTRLNTEANALAVDGVGNVYISGTVMDTSSVGHAFAVKISAGGTKMIWAASLISPSVGTGIAVNDPNHSGQGQAVVAGTLTITNPAVGPLGNHVLVARLSAGGSIDYEYFYTFGISDNGSQAEAVALNTNSTNSTPGSLAYIAGNIIFNGSQQTLAVQFNDSTATTAQGVIWARTLTNTVATPNIDTLTGVAVNADDSSVYSGTAATPGFGTEGIVVGYPADGGPVSQQPPILTELQTRARALNAIAVDSAGNIYVTGAATNPSILGGIYLAELDTQGHFISDLQLGDFGSVDAGYGIVATTSGPLWMVGDTTSAEFSTDGTTLNGTQDGWLASVANS